MTTDKIEKKILLKVPLKRVWRAVSDSALFGAWFGVSFDGPFVAGTCVTGKIVPTIVDAEVAKLQEPHAGLAFELQVDRVDPMYRICFRWHPYAVDRTVDYSQEPTTLIAFELEESLDGTRLTISESGFDQIPLARRAAAFKANDGGWGMQTQLLSKYLAMNANS